MGPAFVTYAKEIAVDFPKRLASDRKGLWIAEAEGEPAGSVMLCGTEDPSVGQLRLFAVEKKRRRQGIGRALMEALLARAEEVGYKRLILWTAGPLEGPYGSMNTSAFGSRRRWKTARGVPTASPCWKSKWKRRSRSDS